MSCSCGCFHACDSQQCGHYALWSHEHNVAGRGTMRIRLALFVLVAVSSLLAVGCKKDAPPEQLTPQVASTVAVTGDREVAEPVKLSETDMVEGKSWIFPETEALTRLNSQYRDIEFAVPTEEFSPDEMQFLAFVIAAADVMDNLFWQQASADGLLVRQEIEGKGFQDDPYFGSRDRLLLRYLSINCGRFDRLDDQKPFISIKNDSGKPLGATFYPPDMTKDEFEFVVQSTTSPELASALRSPYTVVKREGEGLRAVPYSEIYSGELRVAAAHLRKAAAFADSNSMATFLMARAVAFENNEYESSNRAWVRVEGSRFEVVVGPYEIYEDRLLGQKAAFEAFVTIVEPEATRALEGIKGLLPDMDVALPYTTWYERPERNRGTPIYVVNLLYSAGDTRAGMQTIAFNLPNEESVRSQVGSKKVLLRNVMDAKYDAQVAPIAERVISPHQHDYVQRDAFFWHVLLHEVTHGLGPGQIKVRQENLVAPGVGVLPTMKVVEEVDTTVSDTLKELYGVIEEAKADVLGMWGVNWLVQQGYDLPISFEQTMVTFLASTFRTIRFGLAEAHGRANMIIFNWFSKHGVYVYDETTLTYRVDFAKAQAGLCDLATVLLQIEADGSYSAAKDLIEKYGQMNPVVEVTIARLADIPVDIRPVYTTAKEIRRLYPIE